MYYFDVLPFILHPNPLKTGHAIWPAWQKPTFCSTMRASFSLLIDASAYQVLCPLPKFQY